LACGPAQHNDDRLLFNVYVERRQASPPSSVYRLLNGNAPNIIIRNLGVLAAEGKRKQIQTTKHYFSFCTE
jgi:hypothetical protein